MVKNAGDRSGAMSFIRVLKNGNDVIFDLVRPNRTPPNDGGKIFHREIFILSSMLRSRRKNKESKEKKREKGGKTFLGRRFLASAFRGSTVQKILSRVSLFFPPDFERREPARLPFAAYNKLCMAEHFNSLVSSCV